MRHLTVATVIESRRISSDVPFLEMMEIEIKDSSGAHVEWVRLVKNSEDIVFEENDYRAANFTISVSTKTGEEPSVNVTAKDPTGAIRQYMEQYEGGVGFPVRYIIANGARLDQKPELDEQFSILEASAPPGYEVRFSLGAENPLRMRYPLSIQERDRCRFVYKGARCKYAGPMGSCDFSLTGDNGCRAHDNEENFGGFPGLRFFNV